jgi:hypothetical protein
MRPGSSFSALLDNNNVIYSVDIYVAAHLSLCSAQLIHNISTMVG